MRISESFGIVDIFLKFVLSELDELMVTFLFTLPVFCPGYIFMFWLGFLGAHKLTQIFDQRRH